MSAFMNRLLAAALSAILCSSLASTQPALAQGAPDRERIESQFRDWLARSVWPEAERLRISRSTFDRAFASIALDWSLPELQPPGQPTRAPDQRQAEFQSASRYFPEGQLAATAATGRRLLARWRPVLDEVERSTGVPREIVVAIWGRESGFGQVSATRPALRVLATQAFMGRRRELYYPELLAALQILEEGHFRGEELLSSWAGAMGQPQFLPSKFLRFAVDGDGDGRRDIWRSVPDTLASIAHYLREHGWKPERGWGYEVAVPETVPCHLEGPRQGRSTAEWARLGVTRVGGSAVPGGNATGYLLMPAGRHGPAFLVSENFYVLKAYNESDLYALFVGHLGDRMRGGSALSGVWRPIAPMKRGDIQAMQERLQRQGYDVGKADGLIGFATRTATGLWQARHGLSETCLPDPAMMRAVR